MQIKLSHALKDAAGSFSIGFGVGGGNEEVVHIDDKPSLSDHVSEQVIHESLEYCGGVAEAKEHDSGLKKSFVGDEGYLPLVTIFDLDVVVSPMNIEFSKVTSIFQLVHKVGDERERIGITGGVFVEVSIVLAGAEFSILFLDKEERGCLRGVRRADLPSS